MSRIRGKDTAKLPPYVYPRKERNYYIYKPYIAKGRTANPARLCSMDLPISMVWKAYESLTKQRSDTLRWLLDTFNSSPVVKKKTFTSQKQHEGYRNSLCETVGRNGTKFGDLQLSAVNRRMIRRYLDVAEKKVGANRHIQYMKAAWNWGNQRYS